MLHFNSGKRSAFQEAKLREQKYPLASTDPVRDADLNKVVTDGDAEIPHYALCQALQ